MITVVIPTLNEHDHIGALLDQIAREGGSDMLEVLVADGGSTDGTCDVVKEHAKRDPRIRLLHNPRRVQSAAMNLAVAMADVRSDVLVRLDAHAAYPPMFVSRVAGLLRETGADSVVVRLLSCGQGCFQKAVAAVSNSRLGSGGSAHRVGGASRWIDHGHHAGFRRETFKRLRGYDQSFVANEDADYDVRLLRSGGRIWFTSDLEVGYFPRSTAAALARQYYRNGKGRAQNFQKNGGRPKPRQLAPVALLAGVLISLGLAPVTYGLTLVLPGAYLAAAGSTAAMLAFGQRDPCLLGAAVALPIMHFAWAAGFLAQFVRRSAGEMYPIQPARQDAR